MSSERQFLVAKRRNDPGHNDSRPLRKPSYEGNTSRPGNSANPNQNLTKNIASARMKRLRDSLLDDLNKSGLSSGFCTPPSKRFAPSSNPSPVQHTSSKRLASPSNPLPVQHTSHPIRFAPLNNPLPIQSPSKGFALPIEPPVSHQRVWFQPPIKRPADSPYKTDLASRLSKNVELDADVSVSPCKIRSPSKKEGGYAPYKTPSSYRNKSHSTPRISMHSRLTSAATSTPVQHQQNVFSSNQMQNSFTHFVNNNTPSGSNSFNLNDDINIVDISGMSTPFISDPGNLSNNSTSSLVCHANSSSRDDLEDMDWSPVFEETLLSNIRQVREMFQVERNQRLINVSDLKRSSRPDLNYEHVYIIVDTNIFIDKLQTVINIMNITYSDNSFPVIYLPWMVIQELDYFKDGYSLSEKHPVSKVIQTRCRKSVKFINDCLIANKLNFQGQSVQEAAQNRNKTQSADDSILACCIQLMEKGYEVVLLSSDTNLRNKAIISSIKAFAPVDIVKQLTSHKPIKKRKNFVEELEQKLSLICTFILHFEIKVHYGEQEYEKQNFKALPWQFRDCIKYLHKHFEPVFLPHVQKQCRKVVNDLQDLFETQEQIVNEVKFMEMCLSLLIYLQSGLPKYESNIQNIIQEIKQLENEFLH